MSDPLNYVSLDAARMASDRHDRENKELRAEIEALKKQVKELKYRLDDVVKFLQNAL